MAPLALNEYGLIGNRTSAALIGKNGSIDWCCLPYLDSTSHFGALLDDNQGGQFRLAPAGEFRSEQRYLPKSNVLETRFETSRGKAVLTDWMPLGTGIMEEPVIYRRFEVTEGEIHWTMQCQPRFAYGAETAQAEFAGDAVRFRGSQLGDIALLTSTLALEISQDGRMATASGILRKSERVEYQWIWGRNGRVTEPADHEAVLHVWESLAHQCPLEGLCPFAGPWHDAVTRSSLLLRILMPHYAGSLVESVSTSLPSLSGGSRNWDYRYSWIRGSAHGVQALIALGYRNEAKALFDWVAEILIRDGADGLQGVYTVDGGKYLPEQELNFLTGYEGSRPVRIGNLSARQFQLDIYGHAMLTAWIALKEFGDLPTGLWPKLIEIADYACQAWRRPDRGPWEVRAKPQHFVASKVLCWVAIDRACQISEALGRQIPKRWKEERDILHRTICEQGFDAGRRSFVRAFGERELDASALLIPLVGFLPFDDDRVEGTLSAIQEELGDGVLIHRNRSGDGTLESDGAHLICSFWYVSCLALSGRADEASDRLAELCTYSTGLGLYAEQVNPANGLPAGNFPSASGHLSLINAALYVGYANAVDRKRKFPRLPMIGVEPAVTVEAPPEEGSGEAEVA